MDIEASPNGGYVLCSHGGSCNIEDKQSIGAIIIWFLRAVPFCKVLATDRKAAPNRIPVKIPPSEKMRMFVIASTSSDGV